MDTKTLVVGQDVYVVSGWYLKKGKVVKVTPSGVEVELALIEGPIRSEGPELPAWLRALLQHRRKADSAAGDRQCCRAGEAGGHRACQSE